MAHECIMRSNGIGSRFGMPIEKRHSASASVIPAAYTCIHGCDPIGSDKGSLPQFSCTLVIILSRFCTVEKWICAARHTLCYGIASTFQLNALICMAQARWNGLIEAFPRNGVPGRLPIFQPPNMCHALLGCMLSSGKNPFGVVKES